jgi:transposase-like protein
MLRAGRTPREMAESLGVSEQTLRNWRRQDQRDRHARDDGPTSAELEELRRLRRENARLRQERDLAQTSRGLLRSGQRDPVSVYRLWLSYVIEGLIGERFAVLTIFHHSTIDGASGVELMTIMLDAAQEGSHVEPETTPWTPEPPPSDVQMLARGALGLARKPGARHPAHGLDGPRDRPRDAQPDAGRDRQPSPPRPARTARYRAQPRAQAS